MTEFFGRVLAGIFTILIYEAIKQSNDKLFFSKTKFLKNACKKTLGVECLCGICTVNGERKCIIAPIEKYDYLLFTMGAVNRMKKLSEEELEKVIVKSFVLRSNQSGS